MRNITMLCIGALSALLVGCNDVDVVDGRIPAEYLEQSRVLVGTYAGQMEMRAVTLTLALDGDRMVMTSSPDFLGEGCQSAIGNLKKVKVDGNNNNYTVEGGSFAFDPNLCSMNVRGRQLDVRLRNRNGRIELTTSVLAETEWRQECRMECRPMPGGGMDCQQRCDYVPYSTYFDGRFVKTN